MSTTATMTPKAKTPKKNAVVPAPPIQIESSLFVLPGNGEKLTIAFQRALGMATGTIISVDENGQGVVEIDGYRYEFEDGRFPLLRKKHPFAAGQELPFTFWPTSSKRRLKSQEAGDPPRLKIPKVRKSVSEQGAVEVIGQVHKISDDSFLMRLFSKEKRKDYFVEIVGKYGDQVGDYVQAIGKLEAGEIRYIGHSVLYRKE